MKNKTFLLILLCVCIVTVFPFLGETLFQSKGEPREAIVAVSMLQTDNWILPINNGGDIAYKPPFFHWCIAAFSTLTGQVTEYTSRLPSALAMILMVVCVYLFYARRRGTEVALVTALVTLTAFEVHRGGWACRVDMVLTLFIVLALLQLFRWQERGGRGFPYWAVLWMSCATLTKGPVGIILPCLVTGVFMLLRGRRFWYAVGKMAVIAVASCVLPAVWYIAAYQQGGEEFFNLVMEENFGRFMGKMSYESHVHGMHYNFITVLSGYVPYTLLLVMALPWAIRRLRAWQRPKHWWQSFKTYIREMDEARLFSLLSIVLIFVFYCIPKSKRSTYLLPIYPFLAYFLAEFLLGLSGRRSPLLRAYGVILSVVAFLPMLAFFLIKGGVVSKFIPADKAESSFGLIVHIMETTPIDWIHWVYIVLPVVAIFIFVKYVREKRALLYPVLGLVFTIYISLDSVYQPEVMNAKSDKPIAEAIRAQVPEGNLYSYISIDMMRYFTVNFYLGNRVLQFENEQPREGYLLIGPNDYESFVKRHTNYEFEEVYRSVKKSCDTKQPIVMYRFRMKH